MREKLLFLVHRIPYPPNKGDKIRSYNFLVHLNRNYDVFLGTFIDSTADDRYRAEIARYCRECCVLDLRPRRRKLASLLGLLTGEALSVRYFFNAALQSWVDRVMAEHAIRNVLVFSSPMARYVERLSSEFRCVVDFVDVDSQKWLQYSREHPWPMSWIYAREGRRLLAYERAIADRCDHSVFVSQPEARLFQTLAPEVSDRVCFVENGVDTDYFRPDDRLQNPYREGARVLVFTGAMDYWANVDAVVWFAREVLPAIRQAISDAEFFIVGSNPTPAVAQLARIAGVHVSGSVPDIRPYLQHAVAAVAPLRIARGVQNKVLEAMAMARPVIATSHALEGIDGAPSDDVYAVDSAEAMCDVAVRLLQGPRTVSEGSRAYIACRYDWHANSAKIEGLIRGGYAAA